MSGWGITLGAAVTAGVVVAGVVRWRRRLALEGGELLEALFAQAPGELSYAEAVKAFERFGSPENVLLLAMEKTRAQRSGELILSWEQRVQQAEAFLVQKLSRGERVALARKLRKMSPQREAELRLLKSGVARREDGKLVSAAGPFR